MKRFLLALVLAVLLAFALVPFAAEAQRPPCGSGCMHQHEIALNQCRREKEACGHMCGIPWDAKCYDMCVDYWCACNARACDAYEKCVSGLTCKGASFDRRLCTLCYRDR